VGFLKRLKKRADKEPKMEYTSGEYPESMDGAYVHGGYDAEEEASAKEIQKVLGTESAPLTKEAAAERLARLEELKNDRIITEAEFERLWQEIRKHAKM
jgi:hypothetical protein